MQKNKHWRGRHREGDAQIEMDGRWVAVFRLRKGRVTFIARSLDIDDANDPITQVVFELAKTLNATVRGEEGEIYYQPN